ncbi:MAG: aminotransferase class I/II-fold pyridoxal phosphate-dependent enzyme [Parvicellaceae bacterium]
MKTAIRLNNIKEYYFSKKLREIDKLRSNGIDVINAGIGSPDLAPHHSVITELKEQSNNENAHKYQSYKGIPELRNAFSIWYKNYFDSVLNPNSEILPSYGFKRRNYAYFIGLSRKRRSGIGTRPWISYLFSSS